MYSYETKATRHFHANSERKSRKSAWFLPGVRVHQGGRGLPLGRSSLEDLIDLVLVVYGYLLQSLNDDGSLGKTREEK